MAYIGQTLTEGTRRVYTYVATASQTTFNAVYGVGAVDVYQNGVLLQPSDYTASNGTTVVLGTGAALSDEITIVCHNTFSVADTVSSSQGGTFNGPVSVNGSFTSQGIDDNATSTAMTLDSAGNLGIGTGSPSGKLDVLTGTTGNVLIDAEGGSDYHAKVINDAGDLHLGSRNTSADTYITSQRNTVFKSGSSETEHLRIAGSGDIGIGNSNPQRKLVVSESGANGIEIDPNISGQSEIISYNRSNSQYTPLNVAASVISLNDRVGIKTSSLRDGVVHEIQSGISGYGAGVLTRIGQLYTYTRNFTNTGSANNPIQIVTIGYDHNNWSSQYFKVEVFNDYYSSGGEAAYILDANGNTARQLYANNVQGSFSTSYVQVHNNLSRRTFTWNGNQYRSYGFRCTFGMTAVNVDPAASQVRLS